MPWIYLRTSFLVEFLQAFLILIVYVSWTCQTTICPEKSQQALNLIPLMHPHMRGIQIFAEPRFQRNVWGRK
ncbi:hypothetical protein CFP56_020961 [Quercus suber]|uniref:Secreted protein n=1 Tax=Quercus suber TaxID=58331 RepID=A0AAW0M2F5_QUESU